MMKKHVVAPFFTLFVLFVFAGGRCHADGGYADVMAAAEAGDCAAVEKMVGAGADVSVRAEDSSPLLNVAAQYGCLDACRMLIERGAKVDDANLAGETPLIVATFFGHRDIMRLLAEKGADIFNGTKGGNTPLFFSTVKDDEETTRLVIELAKARLDSQGVSDDEKRQRIAEYVNAADDNGWTPLMNAAWAGNVGLARMLLELGADINANDNIGMTALSMARRNNKPEVEQMLIESGARQ